jgi:hypothetical protein
MLARIDAPHFCCGIVLSGEVVTRAAPIVAYMIGWGRDRVRGYCRTKSWDIRVVRA